MSIRGIGLIQLRIEIIGEPCEYGIEPPGFISHEISSQFLYLVHRKILTPRHWLVSSNSGVFFYQVKFSAYWSFLIPWRFICSLSPRDMDTPIWNILTYHLYWKTKPCLVSHSERNFVRMHFIHRCWKHSFTSKNYREQTYRSIAFGRREGS